MPVSKIDPAFKDLHKKNGLQMWRVNKFNLDVVPQEERGVLYSGDTYICLYKTPGGDWDVHFWLGNKASQDEVGVAVIKTIEIDDSLGGFAVQHREVQGYESAQFLSYFPDGIRYQEGGHETGFEHVEEAFSHWKPRLFHCKGKRNVRCQQVECSAKSLNLGDVFILDLGKDIYVWMPPDSGRLERIRGMAMAKSMAQEERHGASTVYIIDNDWQTDETFWQYFGGKDGWKKLAKAKDDDEGYWKAHNRTLTLWRVCDASGDVKITKVAQGEIARSLLDSKDAFILDAGRGGIFVWVGKECTQEERQRAVASGEKFLKQRNLPLQTEVSRVLDGSEPASFIQWFGEWKDAKQSNAFQPRLYQISDASGRLIVEEIANFNQENLDGDDVMILDALHTLYVWIGAGATQNERKGAEDTAKKFLADSQLPRRQKTAIETMVQGRETPIFKKFFPNWDPEMFEGQARSIENMRKIFFK